MKTRAPAGCWVQDGEQTQQAASSQKRHPWRMHVDVWQNQYNTVKLKKNYNNNKKEERGSVLAPLFICFFSSPCRM